MIFLKRRYLKTEINQLLNLAAGVMLAAVRCEKVIIGGRPGGTIVAFARENIGNGEYQALIGGSYG